MAGRFSRKTAPKSQPPMRLRGPTHDVLHRDAAGRLFRQLFAVPTLRGRRLHALQHRVARAVARHEDRQRNGRNGENDRRPGGHLGENIDGPARAKGRLRALPAERACQVRALARLQQDDPDQDKTNEDMKNRKKIDHWVTFE